VKPKVEREYLNATYFNECNYALGGCPTRPHIYSGCTRTRPVEFDRPRRRHNGHVSTCPSGEGWLPGMMCQQASISCLTQYSVQSIGVTYGYATPAPPIKPFGTIVILSGEGGTTPADQYSDDQQYASDYLAYGFQVVMVKWGYDWEDATNGNPGPTSNVGYAACRPYTLLNHIYSTLYASIYNPQSNPNAGMCVQGESAGGGATAFVLAWYGGTSFLDNVELMSGPPISRFDLGCEVPQPPLI
jgi:hypothetical protein